MPLLPGILNDVFVEFGVPGGGAASEALACVFKRRLDKAREILLDELRKGNAAEMEIANIDESVAIIYRYMRAAQEGAARLNLRLLAKIIAGKAISRSLFSDQFLRYSEILASLSREEVVLLATLYSSTLNSEKIGGSGHEKSPSADKLSREKLVGTLFRTRDEYEAAAGALLRTGLVLATSGWGALVYSISPAMRELAATVDFEDILRAEMDEHQ